MRRKAADIADAYINCSPNAIAPRQWTCRCKGASVASAKTRVGNLWTGVKMSSQRGDYSRSARDVVMAQYQDVWPGDDPALKERAARAVGRALSTARKRKGASQEAVALQAGVAVATLSNLERGVSGCGGTANPTLWTLVKLFATLGVRIVECSEGDAARKAGSLSECALRLDMQGALPSDLADAERPSCPKSLSLGGLRIDDLTG